MIASLGSDRDIVIYLTSDETNGLSSKEIEGILIKMRAPKIQYKLKLSVNQEKSGRGFGVLRENESYQVFAAPYFYDQLMQIGGSGGRYNDDGSKVTLVDESRADDEDMGILENLKFYKENRDRLPPEFGIDV